MIDSGGGGIEAASCLPVQAYQSIPCAPYLTSKAPFAEGLHPVTNDQGGSTYYTVLVDIYGTFVSFCKQKSIHSLSFVATKRGFMAACYHY